MRPVLLSASASLAVCLGYAGAGPITELMRGETEKPAPVSSFEDSKTDFISVAVFDGGKVSGYFSFRVAFLISDAARALEVQYLASDISIRKKLSISQISSSLPALSREFEREIKSQIESRLPASLVESVRVIDFAFDARI